MDKQIVLQSFSKTNFNRYKIYSSSVNSKNDNFFFMVKNDKEKYLVVVGTSELCKKYEGNPLSKLKISEKSLSVRTARLNHHNLILLREIFPYLSPSVCSIKASFGTGDRLGIATPAHIQAFKGKDIFPVLAQQSVRENSQTGRTLQEVLDDASWGCFEAGYRGKFGADADHIKKIEDLKEAVDCGYTMFTVDPSDFVRDDTFKLSNKEKSELYNALSEKKELENLYLNKTYNVAGQKLKFDEESLRNIILIYLEALKHTVKCYKFLSDYKKGDFDFEVSVDETSTPTSPLAHIFIAQELQRNKVDFQNLALHFVGDWQKGIDYIGDVQEFARELFLHAAIAKIFGGYRLSLHSGSDKFSAYPSFAEKTKGSFHIKTAGTSYLEAIKVIAKKNPSLYRKIHRFALENFEKDKSLYHVTTDISRIPNVDRISDDKLEDLFKNPDSRQLIHITYGSVLTAKKKKGNFLFRDQIYKTLFQNEEDHYKEVSTHIKRHLDLLKV